MPPGIAAPKRPVSLALSVSEQNVFTFYLETCSKCRHRLFSSTTKRPTRLRRDMFGWLNGPGAAFRDPLPGSTNYLSAYDKKGQLIRGTGEDGKTSKEALSDLKPFPHNLYFQSQPVLSEELRNEVWRRVKEQNKTVRAVSVELGIDMRRVAAVVRLVEIEKRWVREVCPIIVLSLLGRFHDEQNRLVFMILASPARD